MSENFKRIRVGARVQVLQPDYAAGKIGIIRSPEELVDATRTDRWIIEVEAENLVLSLPPQDFQVLD